MPEADYVIVGAGSAGCAIAFRLAEAGRSVVVIEHNLDVVAEADWVIDLGPEGGADGGRILVEGPPEEVAKAAHCSATGASLKEFFSRRSPGGRA